MDNITLFYLIIERGIMEMKSFIRKGLMLGITLCLIFLGFGFGINVKAAAIPATIGYADIPEGYDSNGTSGEIKLKIVTENDLTVKYSGINTKSSATGSAYSYSMFIKNYGYVYSYNCPEGYYPTKVSVNFSSGTGVSGKVGISYSTDIISTRDSSVTDAVEKNGKCELTNADKTKLYWNFSTTGANVQVTSITVEYDIIPQGNVDLESISVSAIELKPGKSIKTSIAYTPFNATNQAVSYEITTGSDIASVDEKGIVTGLKQGNAVLTITPKDTHAQPINVNITVCYPAPQGIVLNNQYIIVASNESTSYKLTGVVKDSGTTSIYVDSKNPEFPLTAVEGIYANTVAFKNGDDYLSVLADDNKISLSTELNANSSWIVSYSSDTGLYSLQNIGFDERYLQYFYNSGSPKFAAYKNTQTNVNLVVYEAPTNQLVAPTNVSVDASSKVTFTANDVNATSYTIVVKDSEGVTAYSGVIENNGILPINKKDEYTVQIKAKADDFLDSDYSVAYVWDNLSREYLEEKTVTEFIALSDNAYYYYRVVGLVKSTIDNSQFTITDGTNDLIAYDIEDNVNGGMLSFETADIGIGDTIVLYGYKKTYSSKPEIIGYYVSRTKNYGNNFSILETKANMKIDYTTSLNSISIDTNFIGTASSQKNLSDGWTSDNIGGTYASPFWQSFRNNGEYILSGDFEYEQSAINVAFTCYLNNNGSSGNKSSKIKFEALGADDSVIDVCTSEEINTWKTGVGNYDTLIVNLIGEGIAKVKISFIKDGGGNVAFSNVKINSANTYEITKEENKNVMSMQFAGFITADLKEKLESVGDVTYGMLYFIKSTYTMSDVIQYLNSGNNMNATKSIFAGLKVISKAPSQLQGVDETGLIAVDDDPSYYQFGVSINNISNDNIDTEVTAAAFICLEGKYYAMQEKSYSVKTMAEAYVKATNTSSYSNHLGVLTWLSLYESEEN